MTDFLHNIAFVLLVFLGMKAVKRRAGDLLDFEHVLNLVLGGYGHAEIEGPVKAGGQLGLEALARIFR